MDFPLTLAIIIPVIGALTSIVGAGYAASWLIDQLRARFPLPTEPPNRCCARLFYKLLYAQQWARYSTFVLAVLISLICSTAYAWLTGGDIGAALDKALAAALAIIASQVRHASQALDSHPAYATPAPLPLTQQAIDAGTAFPQPPAREHKDFDVGN